MNIRPGIWFFILLVVFFCTFHSNSSAQGEWNQWRFGSHISFDFNSGVPIQVANNAMGAADGTVSESDSLGNLVFYSQGSTVWDRNDNIMPNGTGLYGYWQPYRPMLALKNMVNDSTYYLFTVGNDGTSPPWYGLHYSVLDLRMNGGMGDIDPTRKNIPLTIADSAFNFLYGTRHRNNRDAWIVVKQHPLLTGDTWYYMAFLVTPSGVDTTPILSPTDIHPPVWSHGSNPGQLKISTDGKVLFCTSLTSSGSTWGWYADLCHFDNVTGHVTHQFRFQNTATPQSQASPYFAEFSPDNHYLYVSAGNAPSSFGLYQYDVTLTDSLQFLQSEVYLGSGCQAMQLGPDGKIYLEAISGIFPYYYIDSLHVINDPNMPGIACNYQKNALSTNGQSVGNSSIPQFLQKYFAYVTVQDICSGDTVNFTSSVWPPADTIHWNFDNPASGSLNTSDLAAPSHIYTSSGIYQVMFYVRHNDMRSDTVWRTVHVYATPQPTIGPDQTICEGQTATFNAGACPGCTYKWANLTTGNQNAGSGQLFTTGIAGTYAVTVSTPEACIGRDTIQLTLLPGNPVVVSISANSTTVCYGEQVTLSATGNPAGSSPFYQWKVNGFNVGPNNPSYTYIPANGDCVICEMTSNAACISGNPATSNQICMTVNPLHPVSLIITSTSTHTCAGTSVTFNAFPTNPGNTPVYLWKVNGVNVGTNNQVFTYTPANGDCITCQLTSDIICPTGNPSLSNSICMIVDQPLPVSITVTTPQTMVCAGTLVTFTANPTHGGSLPGFQWNVNAVNVSGATSSTYTYVPLNGDIITCQLTSSNNCVTGNPAISPPVTMTVNPNFEVTVSITASSNPFCAGSQVTYTATPDHGGPVPGFQWKVNGGNAGTNSPLFTYAPANGDQVSCTLNSSASCITGNPALSNIITMTVNTNLPAGVSISTLTNPFCPGTSVTITATPTNGGLTPVYQWKLNGANAGTNLPTFTFNPAAGDSVRCVMTSNLNCLTGNPASSARIILTERAAPNVTFTSCFDTVTILGAQPFSLHGGLPLGGQYSGPGVNTGIFTPSVAGTGLKTITYGYANVYTCLATKTKTILVQPNPSFTCGNNLTDIRDNKRYPTVQIGSQCWMASNLDFGVVISDLLPQTDNCIAEKYHQNSSIYQWDELVCYAPSPGSQGLCPPGWHIPTAVEWNTLLAIYSGPGMAGGYLKDSLLVNGFHSYQRGFLYLNNTWAFTTGLDAGAMYWTSSASGADRALARGLNNYNPSVSRYPSLRGNAFQVRCCKD